VLLFVLGALLVAPLAADPTRPPTPSELAEWQGEPSSSREEWKLESVLIADSRRVAVINGRRAQVGERISGARVIDIQPTHVSIETEEETLRLRMNRLGAAPRE
jgi:MSHA biogenesis protein MshK